MWVLPVLLLCVAQRPTAIAPCPRLKARRLLALSALDIPTSRSLPSWDSASILCLTPSSGPSAPSAPIGIHTLPRPPPLESVFSPDRTLFVSLCRIIHTTSIPAIIYDGSPEPHEPATVSAMRRKSSAPCSSDMFSRSQSRGLKDGSWARKASRLLAAGSPRIPNVSLK